MGDQPSLDEIFDRRIEYPDFDAQERLSQLVGLDNHKLILTKQLSLLVNPIGLKEWGKEHHPGAEKIIDILMRRPPLIILEGDVGAGKTELAETIGDAVARQESIDITLLPLSLSTRGQGRVGEMTQLLTAAFDYTVAQAKKMTLQSGGGSGAIILLIDEADALAQSRELTQMHHEDRAGVNAFIRGIDKIGNSTIPAAVIMCTNRLIALDPAIRRRASEILTFKRPTDIHRKLLLSGPLKSVGYSDAQILEMVAATGPSNGRSYGFTFSDLTQRLLPTVILDAYPNNSVNPTRGVAIVQSMVPTPPFMEGAA